MEGLGNLGNARPSRSGGWQPLPTPWGSWGKPGDEPGCHAPIPPMSVMQRTPPLAFNLERLLGVNAASGVFQLASVLSRCVCLDATLSDLFHSQK